MSAGSVPKARLARALALLVILSASAACGGRARSNEAALGSQSVVSSSKSPAAAVTPGASVIPQARASTAQKTEPRPIQTPTGKAIVGKGSYPLDVTIDPSCGSPGTKMTATISTGPNAKISLQVGYSDAKDHGQKGFFDADEKGKAVYEWTILPDAPMGQGYVLVSAGDANNHGNGGAFPFFVKPRGEC